MVKCWIIPRQRNLLHSVFLKGHTSCGKMLDYFKTEKLTAVFLEGHTSCGKMLHYLIQRNLLLLLLRFWMNIEVVLPPVPMPVQELQYENVYPWGLESNSNNNKYHLYSTIHH